MRKSNAVADKISQGKRLFDLRLLWKKLAFADGLAMSLNVLVTNLEQLLKTNYNLFIVLLCFALVY